MSVSGKTVLITGASRGIGAATARIFASEGANVALASRSRGAIEDLATEIGPSALPLACDVGDFVQVEAAVAATVNAFGRLDVLIGNAGVIGPIEALAASDPADWGAVIDINLKGVYHGARAALPVMLGQGGGTIINISSGAAHSPLEAWSAYCASKAGAAMVTRSIHHEYGSRGIRAMGLSPGTVATQMQRDIKASGIGPVAKLEWEDHIQPDWPARTCLWMCGAAGDDWLGQEIALRDEAIRRAVGLIP